MSKPSPRIYQAALRKLKIKAREALAVEDTAAGVRAAVSCGIPVIGMRGTLSSRDLRRAGAFRTIAKLTELLDAPHL